MKLQYLNFDDINIEFAVLLGKTTFVAVNIEPIISRVYFGRDVK